MDLILAIRTLAEELYFVALTIDGHVASHGKGFEDGALVTGDGEGVRTLHLTKDGDLVVVDGGVDDIVCPFLDKGGYLLADEGIGLLDGESLEVDLTDKGEVYLAIVLDKVMVDLARALGQGDTQAGASAFVKGARLNGIEQDDGLGGAGEDEDGEHVLRLDGHVVEVWMLGAVEGGGVLEGGHLLVVGTAGQQE